LVVRKVAVNGATLAPPPRTGELEARRAEADSVVVALKYGMPPETPHVTVTGKACGIPGFTSTTTEASSALLTANSRILGGGAGATPSTATFLTTNGANQFNVGVVGSGSGCIGLAGTTSGTSTICGPNAGGGEIAVLDSY
jgi:hypothetical protein